MKIITEAITGENKKEHGCEQALIMCQIFLDIFSCEITVKEVLSKSRRREVVRARSICCYYLRKEGYTYEMIGDIFNKTHASIIYLVKIFHKKAKGELSAKRKYLTKKIKYATKLLNGYKKELENLPTKINNK